jgi:uncharacterized membrane protein HdeD (DUF308 family)
MTHKMSWQQFYSCELCLILLGSISHFFVKSCAILLVICVLLFCAHISQLVLKLNHRKVKEILIAMSFHSDSEICFDAG